MRAPTNIELVGYAFVLFVLGSAAISDYYPAAQPVLGPDGLVLHGPDGKVLVHRDMTQYFRMMLPTYILFSCGAILLIWFAVRLVVRFLHGRKKQDTPAG